MKRFGSWVRICLAGMISFASVWFILHPAASTMVDLTDPALQNGDTPRSAMRLFEDLTPRFEAWARQRVASGRGEQMTVDDLAGTEWPLFGAVFYLWSVESLQDEWESNPDLMEQSPSLFARGAVEAAKDLVIDPGHAKWVRDHWGDDYLKKENVAYRMFFIAALTSHARLTGSTEHLLQLREQVDSLAGELDASAHGLLDDYPGECYPGDVLTAVAMIRRADNVLGTDHSEFAQRAIRGFIGNRADPLGLPPYAASSTTGAPLGMARGCSNSYVCLFGPELWPSQSSRWYQSYSTHYWNEELTAVGFREFPKNYDQRDWWMDIDAGPVLAGHGFAACAFGVGAARVNGYMEHAYPLSTELLALSWRLPDGTLAGPRLLSNLADAPHLGEAAILFNLTRVPDDGVKVVRGGTIPIFVFIVLVIQWVAGLAMLLWAYRLVRGILSAK